MNTKLLSEKTLSVIDEYQNFKVGKAVCSVPYYNNRHVGLKGALRAEVGKGSPKDIYDEVNALALVQKINIENFDNESLKKFLVDNNIGIDCSGFAYYILDEESRARGKGALDKHISFVNVHNILSKFRAKTNPEKNTDVSTLADDKNSKSIPLKIAEPGDMITLIGGPEGGERDHVLIISQIEYQNFVPTVLHYVHAVAWPTDGEYGHGIHWGKIEILDPNKSLTEQRWTENEKIGQENYTFARALVSKTEIRRINLF